MTLIEICLVGVSLAMDAFAVSICKGLSMKSFNIKKATTIALYFGIFQAVMPLIGFLLGVSFSNLVESIDHWIAFVLLSIIGIKMIKDAFACDEEGCDESTSFKTMIVLAVATSIDALAVGITFAFLKSNITLAVTLIGIITFTLSFIGVKLGNKVGAKIQTKAEILGGAILILIGIKILLEHLNVL